MDIDAEIEAMFTAPKKEATNIFDAFKEAPAFKIEAEVVSEEEILSDPEVVEAITRVEITAQEVAKAKEAMADVQAERDRIKEERSALLRQIAALDKRENELYTNTFEQRGTLNRATTAHAEAERYISVVKANVTQRRKMATTVEEYGRVATNFPWYTGVEVNGKTLKCLPHQWEGIKFLASAGRAILGDEMGLGKTLTAIAALDLIDSKRALVICPAEVTSNFLREVKRWAGHRKVVNLHGKSKIERNAILSMATMFEPVVVVVNYEAWRKDLSLLDRLIDVQFDTLIADEAHSVKGTNTDAFAGVQRIALADNSCPYCGGLLGLTKNEGRVCLNHGYIAGKSFTATDSMSDSDRSFVTRSVKHLWMMTGTPILNAPADLYPMLHLIDPLGFPYKNAYLKDYCWMGGDGKYVFKPGGLTSLTKRLSGRYLARNLESAGVVLPPQDVIMHVIDFPDDSYLMQQEIITQLTEHAAIVLAEDNKMSAIGVLALITRQRQANVWPGGIKVWEHPKDEFGFPDKSQEKVLVFDASHVKESIKVDKVMELVNEHVVENKNRVAVFSQFKTGLAELEARLNGAGIRTVRFDGDTTSAVKDAVKRNFDKSIGESPRWEVVLCNYKTGGVGLNLTAATHTIIMDEEWNPGKRDQAYARTHRMGQDENTFVHLIRLSHTVDTWLADLIEEKEDMIQGFDSATIDIQKAMLDAIKGGAM